MGVTRVTNVVFDMGGVLVEWDPRRILAGFYDGEPLRESVNAALFSHPDWRAFNRGDLGEEALLQRVEQRSGRPAGELDRLLGAMRASLQPKPETVRLLRSLQARGVPLYCLSDMPAGVYDHLRSRLDFWDAFSGIVISSHVRLCKPEPAIYGHLLEAHGLEAARTVFIDDMPANVAGAREAGLQAIRFGDIAQVEAELLALLGG